jgi:hypothetical protein
MAEAWRIEWLLRSRERETETEIETENVWKERII